MRFRFCGDLDCPDWLLAEISTLSRLTSIKMKLLCVQVVKDLMGEPIDYEKVRKLTSDAKFELGDMKAVVAALRHILSHAAKYQVDSAALGDELQQLGLPREHAVSFCKTYADNVEKLQAQFQEDSMRLSKMSSVDWRVDYVLSSSELKAVGAPSVQLRLGVQDPDSGHVQHTSFTSSPDRLSLLIHELKLAQTMMNDLGS